MRIYYRNAWRWSEFSGVVTKKMRRVPLHGLLWSLLCTVPAFSASFTNGIPLNTPRSSHTSTLLSDGRVLVVGGLTQTTNVLSSTEIFDPNAGIWIQGPRLHSARQGHCALLLFTGEVLVVGGDNGSTAEIFNPIQATWRQTAPMNFLHDISGGNTLTLLRDGRALLIGGCSPEPCAEIYDSDSDRWTPASLPAYTGLDHTATLLTNGTVLVINGTFSAAAPQIYNPQTDAWTATRYMNEPRDNSVAVLMADSRVLVCGGVSKDSGYPIYSTEIYDTASSVWVMARPLLFPQSRPTGTLLTTGNVMITGGDAANSSPGAGSDLAEMYDPSNGTWTNAGLLVNPRIYHCATLLAGGKLLLIGGQFYDGAFHDLSSVEVYDPTAANVSSSGPLKVGRFVQTTTLMTNGNILIAGGHNGTNAVSTAEIYNPGTGSSSTIASMAAARYMHSATLLMDGTILVAGGYNGSSSLSTVELFDPKSRSWVGVGPLSTASRRHTATLLTTGKVLAAGGYSTSALKRAELYDPFGKTWALTTPMGIARYAHTANLLADLTVMVAGGTTAGSSPLRSVEIYDPVGGTWKIAGDLKQGRWFHASTLLPNGKVLVTGGTTTGSDSLNTAEVYDSAAGTWSYTGALNVGRRLHRSCLLPNGQVLITGGATPTGASINSAEIYDPATKLFKLTTSLSSARAQHATTLLPSGKVMVSGGFGNVALTSVEMFDVGFGANVSWRPAISNVAPVLEPETGLTLSGSLFRGISGASSGTAADSPTDHPIVQLRAIDGGQVTYLACLRWSGGSFRSDTFSGFPSGPALLTVFANGIWSSSAIVSVANQIPAPPTLNVPQILSDGSVQLSFTSNPGKTFDVMITPDMAAGLGTWNVIGTANEFSPGHYQFTDTNAARSVPQRFYRVRFP